MSLNYGILPLPSDENCININCSLLLPRKIIRRFRIDKVLELTRLYCYNRALLQKGQSQKTKVFQGHTWLQLKELLKTFSELVPVTVGYYMDINTQISNCSKDLALIGV
jgi:hypothetical protein